MSVETDATVDPLARAYRESWARITSRLQRLQDDPLAQHTRRRLGELQEMIGREVAYLEDEVAGRASQAVRWAQEAGFEAGARGAGATDVDFAMMNRDAGRRAADGLYTDLLEATGNVDHTTKRLLRQVGQDAQLQKFIEGRTATDAARRMRELAAENRVYAVRYANGALHQMDSYAEMAMRTVSAEIYNVGLVEGAVAEGAEWFEVFDGPDCGLEFHDDPLVADGLIVDARTAGNFPIAHPNCRRAIGVRPDVTSREGAEAAGRSTTFDQRMDQREADIRRGQPMSERGITEAQQQVRGRPERPDPHGFRAQRATDR